MDFYTAYIQGINTLEDTMAENCNFPVLLNVSENFFRSKGIYSSKGTYVRKKELSKFCNKLSMKVNLPVEFNRENMTLQKQSPRGAL